MKKKKSKLPGRPPLPKSRLRQERHNVFLSRSESRAALRAARAEGFQDIPKWARMLMLREIAAESEKA